MHSSCPVNYSIYYHGCYYDCDDYDDDYYYYLCHCLASGEGIVTLGVTVMLCVCPQP